MGKRTHADQVEELCRAVGADPAQAQSRLLVAEQVFGHTGHLHGLTKTSRPLLRVAALLWGLGRHGHPSGVGPRTVATLLEGRGPNLSPTQHGIVAAAVARASAGAQPSGCGPLPQLSARLRAVLRVAEGLAGPNVEVAAVVDDGEAVDILVKQNGAEWDAAAALAGAAHWNELMPRPIRSIAPHDESAPTPAFLQPRMRAGDAVRAIIQRQLEQFTARDYGLPYEEDLEYVHEMRVALRRLRAALRLFKKMLLPSARALNAELKWFARALGEVRDRDVFLKFLRGYRAGAAEEQAPFVDCLIEAVLAERRHHCGRLLDVFASERYDAFRNEYLPLARRPVGAEDGFVRACKAAGRAVRRLARRRLRERLDRVSYYGRHVDRLTPQEQHALRIDCKRLRYAGEFFADLYAERLSKVVRPMARLQDALGDVHDADVYAERIAASPCTDATGGEGVALETLRAHLARWREESLKTAIAAWRTFTKPKALRRLAKIINAPLEG